MVKRPTPELRRRQGRARHEEHVANGHKNIQHTVRYTELSPHRSKDFWRD
jgi:hypothetical protein